MNQKRVIFRKLYKTILSIVLDVLIILLSACNSVVAWGGGENDKIGR